MNRHWKPAINRARCTGCGACVEQCPEHALGQIAGKATVLEPDACTYCARCETLCPTRAIALPYLIMYAPLSSTSDSTSR
ncbi:MAG: 4Fe-4S binding protein [Chloroflexota bacterium]|jgi:NAD-dependent dihydropyrimidine dehydrogenase PreA subunit|nr:4Fe-4S binding protein [Aggregatilineaceae bacterium]